jgi:PAS domain S-box-containing protein
MHADEERISESAVIRRLREELDALRAREQRLQRAVHRLEAIIDTLPEATFVVDPEGTLIAWNAVAEEITGVRATDVVGESSALLGEICYGPGGKLLVDLIDKPDEQAESRYRRFERHGDRIIAEGYIPGIQGGVGVHLHMTAGPVRDADGDVVGIVETIHDIGEAHRREQAMTGEIDRLRRIERAVEDGPAIVLLRSPEAPWPVEYVSANVQRLERQPEMFTENGLRLEDLIHPDDVDGATMTLHAALRAGRIHSCCRYRVRTPRGGVREIEDHTFIRRDDDGTPLRLQTVLLDRTDPAAPRVTPTRAAGETAD